jgi:hypothetical protein
MVCWLKWLIGPTEVSQLMKINSSYCVCVWILSLLSFLENERQMCLWCHYLVCSCFLCMHTGALKWLHLCTTHVWVYIYVYPHLFS